MRWIEYAALCGIALHGCSPSDHKRVRVFLPSHSRLLCLSSQIPPLYITMRFIVYLANVTIWLQGCDPSRTNVAHSQSLTNPPNGAGGPALQPTSTPTAGGRVPVTLEQLVVLRSIASDIDQLTKQMAIMVGLANEFPQAEIDWDSIVQYADGDFLSNIIELTEQIRSKLIGHVSLNRQYPMYTAVALAPLSELVASARSRPGTAAVIRKFLLPAVEALTQSVVGQDPAEATSIDRLFEAINRSLPPNRRELLVGFYTTAALTLVVSPESRGLIDARANELREIMVSPTSAPGMSWYALKQFSDVLDEDLAHHYHDRPLDRQALYRGLAHPFGPLEL